MAEQQQQQQEQPKATTTPSSNNKNNNNNNTRPQLKSNRSAGTGSQIATISSKFESPQQPTIPKRPGLTPRASSTSSSKRLSASSAAPIPVGPPAKPTPTPTPAPEEKPTAPVKAPAAPVPTPAPVQQQQQQQQPPATTSSPAPAPAPVPAPTPAPAPSTPAQQEDSSVGPGTFRRSLSFKLPIRVSTDNNNFPSPNGNRSRASSLPQESQPSPIDKRRHSTQRSLSSIIETAVANTASNASNNKDLDVPQVDSPKPSPKSPSKQFLLERGLLNPEELPESTSPEELQTSLQEQVVRYLTTMSSPASSNKSTTEEQQRAPAYPTSYPPNNSVNTRMPAPGLPVPMPNLSGNANGPVGNLLKGPVDDKGQLTKAALMVGIKLDLEAEVHVTARVRGDILVGLY